MPLFDQVSDEEAALFVFLFEVGSAVEDERNAVGAIAERLTQMRARQLRFEVVIIRSMSLHWLASPRASSSASCFVGMWDWVSIGLAVGLCTGGSGNTTVASGAVSD